MTLSLEPFRTDVLKEIMADHKENYNNDDLLALYCFSGGVPKYVELLMDNDCTDMEKMVEYMTRPDSQFFDEGQEYADSRVRETVCHLFLDSWAYCGWRCHTPPDRWNAWRKKSGRTNESSGGRIWTDQEKETYQSQQYL